MVVVYAHMDRAISERMRQVNILRNTDQIFYEYDEKKFIALGCSINTSRINRWPSHIIVKLLKARFKEQILKASRAQ